MLTEVEGPNSFGVAELDAPEPWRRVHKFVDGRAKTGRIRASYYLRIVPY